MEQDVRILLKDIPGIKAGTRFIQHPKAVNRWYPENCYENGELIFENTSIHGFIGVEILLPEWFKKEEQPGPIKGLSITFHPDNNKIEFIINKNVGKLDGEISQILIGKVENCLNGKEESGCIHQTDMVYNEHDLRKAFMAARYWDNGMYSNQIFPSKPFSQFKHPLPDDYINSLKQ